MLLETQLPRVNALKFTTGDGYTSHLFGTDGGRTLRVNIYTDRISFGPPSSVTIINARSEQTRVPGSTTALYVRARKLMQADADRLNTPISYTLRTFDPCMQEWAQRQGEEIFNWENPLAPEPYTELVLQTTIFPKQ